MQKSNNLPHSTHQQRGRTSEPSYSNNGNHTTCTGSKGRNRGGTSTGPSQSRTSSPQRGVTDNYQAFCTKIDKSLETWKSYNVKTQQNTSKQISVTQAIDELEQFADTLQENIHVAKRRSNSEETQKMLQKLSEENTGAIVGLSTLSDNRVMELKDRLGHIQHVINDVSTYNEHRPFGQIIDHKIREARAASSSEAREMLQTLSQKNKSAITDLQSLSRSHGTTKYIIDFREQVAALLNHFLHYQPLFEQPLIQYIPRYNEHQQFADSIDQKIREARASKKAPEMLQVLSDKNKRAITDLKRLSEASGATSIAIDFRQQAATLRDDLLYYQPLFEQPLIQYIPRYNEHQQFADSIDQEIREARASKKAQEMLQVLSNKNKRAITDLKRLSEASGATRIATDFRQQAAALRVNLLYYQPLFEQPLIQYIPRYNKHERFADTIDEKIREARAARDLQLALRMLQALGVENKSAIADLQKLSECPGTNQRIADFRAQASALHDHLKPVKSLIDHISRYSVHAHFTNSIEQKIRDARAAPTWPETQRSLETVSGQVDTVIIDLKTILGSAPSSNFSTEVSALYYQLQELRPPIRLLVEKTTQCNAITEEMKANNNPQRYEERTWKINSLRLDISKIAEQFQPGRVSQKVDSRFAL